MKIRKLVLVAATLVSAATANTFVTVTWQSANFPGSASAAFIDLSRFTAVGDNFYSSDGHEFGKFDSFGASMTLLPNSLFWQMQSIDYYFVIQDGHEFFGGDFTSAPMLGYQILYPGTGYDQVTQIKGTVSEITAGKAAVPEPSETVAVGLFLIVVGWLTHLKRRCSRLLS